MAKNKIALAVENSQGLFSFGFLEGAPNLHLILQLSESLKTLAITTGAMVRAIEPFWSPDYSMRAALAALEGAPLPPKMQEAVCVVVWNDYRESAVQDLLADGVVGKAFNHSRVEAPSPNWLQPAEMLVFFAHATRYLAWIVASNLSRAPQARELVFLRSLSVAREIILQRFACAQSLSFTFE